MIIQNSCFDDYQVFLLQTLLQKSCLEVNTFFFSFLLTFHLPDVTNKQCLERDRQRKLCTFGKRCEKSALENYIEYLHKWTRSFFCHNFLVCVFVDTFIKGWIRFLSNINGSFQNVHILVNSVLVLWVGPIWM